MKLLIADDQMSVHKYLEKTMDWKALGIKQIKHAYNGEEAANLVESYHPDLLIIDIQMPLLSGLEALQRIQSLDWKPRTIILSAYDQFEYAREALRLRVSQYILKPIDSEQLRKVLEELIEEARKDILSSIENELDKATYAGVLPETAVKIIQEGFEKLGISSYAALAIDGLPFDHFYGEQQSWEREGIHVCSVRTYKHHKEHVIVVGLHSGIKDAELLQCTKGSVIHWKERYPMESINIGISGIESDAGLLLTRIAECREAVQHSFFEADAIHTYAAIRNRNEGSLELLQSREKAFEDKVRMGLPIPALEKDIRELFEMLRSKRPKPESVYLICYRYLLHLNEISAPGEELQNKLPSIQELMNLYRQVDELENLLQQRLALLSSCQELPLPKLLEMIRVIKAYVDIHYEEDLSLQHVADRFDMDKYQISRTFKQEFNENYWQYVTRIRMEKSAELLRETDLKNNQIAERTGFLDDSYFSRAFKKHFGMSPKDYRSSHKINGL
ncbi:response regulator [Paenibacillus wynnii]|uniref:response regulator n=1 Tax=Paenibacillus wynnii TaxID=268407 RepID=UPI00068E29A9|nr:response regulator [Paenibacillus wynnii]